MNYVMSGRFFQLFGNMNKVKYLNDLILLIVRKRSKRRREIKSTLLCQPLKRKEKSFLARYRFVENT